jgi:hypothetical protein
MPDLHRQRRQSGGRRSEDTGACRGTGRGGTPRLLRGRRSGEVVREPVGTLGGGGRIQVERNIADISVQYLDVLMGNSYFGPQGPKCSSRWNRPGTGARRSGPAVRQAAGRLRRLRLSWPTGDGGSGCAMTLPLRALLADLVNGPAPNFFANSERFPDGSQRHLAQAGGAGGSLPGHRGSRLPG